MLQLIKREGERMAAHKENHYEVNGEYVVGYTYNTNTPFYVDFEDFEKIKPYCWLSDKQGYLIMQKNHKQAKMHRFIMQPPENMVIDHIDGNPANNRRGNLRVCTQQQNMMNSRFKSNKSCGIQGVSWDKARKKWVAQIALNKKHYHLGRYSLIEDAIKARKEAEIRLFGEFAPIDKEK